MIKTLVNAWKVKDIRIRLLYILLVLGVYTFGSHILLPGLDGLKIESYVAANASSSIYATLVSGGYGSIFALGIGPYITASIIMQLLTVAITPLEQLQKEGEEGRKKIGQYTRVLAVVLAALQAAGTVYTIALSNLFKVSTMPYYVMGVVSMVTGTIVIMWLGEFLTEKGIGNGASFIIFANIIAKLPTGVLSIIHKLQSGQTSQIIGVFFTLVIFFFVIMFVVLIQDGERRIPVRYSKKGNSKFAFANQSQYIPLKVNIAGVMSIIFSLSIMQFPQTINTFFQNPTLTKISEFLSMSSLSGGIIYIILIFCFTFFYTSFAINPIEMAENMKKSGSFIPGIRPGKPTSDYIQTSVNRLSWIGATAYAIIAITPMALDAIFNINVGFGGTTLLIVTGVALELLKQLESQLLMRHYKGFLD